MSTGGTCEEVQIQYVDFFTTSPYCPWSLSGVWTFSQLPPATHRKMHARKMYVHIVGYKVRTPHRLVGSQVVGVNCVTPHPVRES